jgi:predicted NBD/HSP70 family sugar kinase
MSKASTALAGANHQSLKRSNRAVVFRVIHARGPISRVELARQTGLNPGTVTKIADELLASGLASELPRAAAPDGAQPGKLGRRPVYLAVNPSARFAVGVDLARSAITAAVVDLTGRPIARVAEPTEPLRGDVVIAQVARIVDRILGRLDPDERAAVVGIGVGAPGPLSTRSGQFLAPPSYGAWEGLDLGREIARRTGLATSVDNNANTAALAELWYGVGQGAVNFVLLNLGTGVGAGLVLDGDLYRGQHDLAGEIGHVGIDLNGPRCACGNYGCLEMYVSVPRVVAAVRAALATGEPSMLRDRFLAPAAGADVPAGEPDGLVGALAAGVRAGDALAVRVMADVARYLAAGIVAIVNALDPGLVLIGRELAAAGDVLLDPVRAEVRRRVLPALRDNVRIEAAAFPDAPVVGAATLSLRDFFASPLAPRAVPPAP